MPLSSCYWLDWRYSGGIDTSFPGTYFAYCLSRSSWQSRRRFVLTQYVNFYDFSNELGHYFRLVSVVLAYLAIVVTGVQRPAEILFRQVMKNEVELTLINTEPVGGTPSQWNFVSSGTLTVPAVSKFAVQVSRYLSNSQYTGNSGKAWYMLADPADLPVIEMVFLNGQESPIVETAQADFNTLGVVMRGYHDFGAALQEPRAGLKAKGEA